MNRNSERHRAWRNVMVAATNAGIAQGIFGMHPGEDHWPNAHGHTGNYYHIYPFDIDGIPGVASVRTDQWSELHINAALWPTRDADQWIKGAGTTGGFLAGACEALGWIERKNGAWLQTGEGRPMIRCRRERLPVVAAIAVEPNGYADHGKLIL